MLMAVQAMIISLGHGMMISSSVDLGMISSKLQEEMITLTEVMVTILSGLPTVKTKFLVAEEMISS